MQRSYRLCVLGLTLFTAGAGVLKLVLVPAASHYDVNTARLDPESVLALGEKLPLAAADLYSLELLPGISDTLAANILEKRPLILARARCRSEDAWEALQLAHGIGPTRARELGSFLALSEASHASDGDCKEASKAKRRNMRQP